MEFNESPPRGAGERTVPGAGAERAQPMKESRKRSFPRPRGGQNAFRGGSFGGSAVFPPQVLRQGDGSCPPAAKRVARLWAPPAPSRRASRGSAGGGFPGFADSTTWDRSARHRNILRNTLNSGVFHMNLPGQPPQIQRYLVSHPAKGYLVNHHSIRIPSPSGGGAALCAAEGYPTRAWETQTFQTK